MAKLNILTDSEPDWFQSPWWCWCRPAAHDCSMELWSVISSKYFRILTSKNIVMIQIWRPLKSYFSWSPVRDICTAMIPSCAFKFGSPPLLTRSCTHSKQPVWEANITEVAPSQALVRKVMLIIINLKTNLTVLPLVNYWWRWFLQQKFHNLTRMNMTLSSTE